MNIEKFRKNLKKINKFNELTDEQLVKISRIEKDILLEYIRKLYKSVQKEADGDSLQGKEEKTTSEMINKEKIQLKPEFTKNNIIEEVEIVTKKIKEEKADEITKSTKSEVTIITPDVQPEVVLKETKPAQEEIKTKVVSEKISPEFLAIFNEKTTKELSEKLSMLPVDDLKKAFGLNEKVFTINELFGGQGDVFESTIKDLNSIGSFSNAKDYILEKLVSRFDWDNEQKIKKAEQFVRLVRRRYMN